MQGAEGCGVSDLISDEAVCRTAPATPGLLITSMPKFQILKPLPFHNFYVKPLVANWGKKDYNN